MAVCKWALKNLATNLIWKWITINKWNIVKAEDKRIVELGKTWQSVTYINKKCSILNHLMAEAFIVHL